MTVYIARTKMCYENSAMFDMDIDKIQTHTPEYEEKLRMVAVEKVRGSYNHPIHDVHVIITGHGVYDNDGTTATVFIRFGHSDTLVRTTNKKEWNRLKLTNPELIFEELDE